MSAWTCRQLSERSPKRSFHLVFESHDGTAYVPIPERSTSLRVTSTPPVVDSQKRLTPNGRLEKRTWISRTVMSAKCQKRTFEVSVSLAIIALLFASSERNITMRDFSAFAELERRSWSEATRASSYVELFAAALA